MKVLICRSKHENTVLKKALEHKGYSVLSIDLFIHKIKKDKNLYLDLYDTNNRKILNIIVTSKFCAQILQDKINRSCNIFIIGNESAKIFENNKNIKRKYIYNEVKELSQDLKKYFSDSKYKPQDFIYYSGNYITQEIINVERKIIYNTQYIDNFSPKMTDNFVNCPPRYILLFSKNASFNLFKILESNDLLRLIKKSVVIGLSRNVTEIFRNSCKILYPSQSDAKSVLNMLYKHSYIQDIS